MSEPLTMAEERMLRARSPDSTTGTGLVHRLLAALDAERAHAEALAKALEAFEEPSSAWANSAARAALRAYRERGNEP